MESDKELSRQHCVHTVTRSHGVDDAGALWGYGNPWEFCSMFRACFEGFIGKIQFLVQLLSLSCVELSELFGNYDAYLNRLPG